MNYQINRDKLKYLMLDGNLSQRTLASEIGMSSKTINKIFSDDAMVTAQTVNKISKLFNVKPSELVVHE